MQLGPALTPGYRTLDFITKVLGLELQDYYYSDCHAPVLYRYQHKSPE